MPFYFHVFCTNKNTSKHILFHVMWFYISECHLSRILWDLDHKNINASAIAHFHWYVETCGIALMKFSLKNPYCFAGSVSWKCRNPSKYWNLHNWYKMSFHFNKLSACKLIETTSYCFCLLERYSEMIFQLIPFWNHYCLLSRTHKSC